MEFKHWNVLSFLNSNTKPCLSFGSTCLETDPNFTFLCGLGLLLLFLCYLVGIPFPTWKTKTTQKRQGRGKRRRKGGTLEDGRWYQREVEETRKLISILRSPLGRHHDTIQFRQLLCPDPSCEVCNSTTAEINRLLFLQALEDSTPLASTAPVTSTSFTLSPDFSAVPPGELIPASLPEPSPPPASIVSPNPVIPVADFFPPSPPGDSLPPEPFPPLDSKFPLDRFPAQPPAFPPPVPLHHAHSVDRGVQTETVSPNTIFSPEPTLSQDVSPLRELSQRVNPTETCARHQAPPTRSASPPPDSHLTVTQSKPISISRKPVPESSPPQSSGGLSTYVPAITGIDPSSLSILDLPHWQTHAKDFFPSTLAPRDFHQALRSSEASSRGDPAANLVEPGNLSLLSPDAPALLEKQVQKRCDFLRWKETKGSFPRERIADKHELAPPLPFWSSKDQSKELPMHQQRPHPATLEEGHLQHTPIQFFWGLQNPHSESFLPAADASDNISNVSPEQESPVVPHPLPPSLPENPPQLLPQTQPLPIPHVQPQAHLQSPLPILPSGPRPDIKICGVCVHRPQNESQSLTSTEMHHLEWNVLQKVQKRVWGLPTVVQRSQEDYCPSAPNPSLSHKATKAQVVIPVPPGQFPLNEELRRKLESHLRKRLIQHRWRLPRRIYECLALMSGPSPLPQLPESQRHGGRSEISNKSQIRWTMSKSMYVEDPEIILLEDGGLAKYEDDLEKDQGHNPENDMGYDSEKELRSPSVKNSTVSVETMGQRQFENALKTHLRRKSEEISEGQLPGTVHNSWHTMKQTPLPSERSQTEIKQGSLPPSEVEDYSLNSFQERPFVEPNAAQKLEDHIKRLNKRVPWGLPPRVLESIQHFTSKESTYSLDGSLKSLHGDQAGIATSAPIPDHPLPATSTVDKEEQRIRRQSPSNINHQLAEGVLKTKDGSQALTSVRHDTIGNRQPPRLPTRQGAFRREPKGKSANSGAGRGRQQGTKTKNPEPAVVPPESREIFRTKEFHTHQSQPSILTTDKPVSSQIIQGNEHQVKTTIPPNTPIPHDPKSLHVKEPRLHEFNLTLEDRERSQAQVPYTGLPPASDHLPYKASLTQGVSRGDTRASQVLHVHPEDTGITMEQQQEPWVPKHVLRRCQNKNPPPAAKAMWPPGSKAQERGGGDAGLGTCQPTTNRFPTEGGASKKRFPTQDAVWKVKLGSQPSQTLSQKGQLPPESLSQKGQPPPESLFRKKMRDFVQWLTPVMKGRRQENSQEKRSPLSSAESRGLPNGRAAFTRTPEAPKITTAVGKFQEERMGRLRAIGSTFPQQPIPSPTKFGKTQQKAQVPAQAQPVPGYPFNYRVPAHKETNTGSCQQEAVFAGQGLIGSNRQLRNKDRQPQRVGAFKDQLPHQKYPLSVPLREPAPHQKTTCGHQAAQWPPATLTTPAGTVGKDVSLPFTASLLFTEGNLGKDVSLPFTASLLFTEETSPEFPGRGFGGAFPTPK